MTRLVWDDIGQRQFENGVDHGVLYPRDKVSGEYPEGFVWNGLTTVTESPSGAEPTALWADNIKYANLMSAEEFGATIEAYTYPDEFVPCDGSAELSEGVYVGQQDRQSFGFSYRSQIGNDVSPNAGYKLHLLYGCMASPSEKAYTTINDSPDAITFSWDLTTTPVAVPGLKPTAVITIDSTKANAANLAALEDILYGPAGSGSGQARLPLPDEVATIFGNG
jgi:hypothetical protein